MASGDLVAEYLDDLRSRLARGVIRTSREGAVRIAAEAEDHLREAAAAGIAAGMREEDAQRAAIAAFGQARAVARAHRPPASSVLTAMAFATCPLLAAYALVAAALGGAILCWKAANVWNDPAQPGGAAAPHQPTLMSHLGGSAVLGREIGTFVLLCMCATAGLALLAGYLIARRRQRARDGMARVVPLPGFFPPVAAAGLLMMGLAEVMAPTRAFFLIDAVQGGPELAIGAFYASMVMAVACAGWSAVALTRWTLGRIRRRRVTLSQG